MTEKFDIDLLEGKAVEDAFAHVLCHATVEVKSDRICIRGRNGGTGRICIEYQQRATPGKDDGRPSGIAVSKARWWAIEYDENCWIVMPRERVADLARRAWAKALRADTGDNGNRSVLVPIEWFVQEHKPSETADDPVSPIFDETFDTFPEADAA